MSAVALDVANPLRHFVRPRKDSVELPERGHDRWAVRSEIQASPSARTQPGRSVWISSARHSKEKAEQ